LREIEEQERLKAQEEKTKQEAEERRKRVREEGGADAGACKLSNNSSNISTKRQRSAGNARAKREELMQVPAS
jgi:hypothetical protein